MLACLDRTLENNLDDGSNFIPQFLEQEWFESVYLHYTVVACIIGGSSFVLKWAGGLIGIYCVRSVYEWVKLG